MNIKVFGVTSLKRLALPALRDTPTLTEAGLEAFDVQVWHGLYAPKGTPAPIISRLNTALREALRNPDLIKRQEALGLTVVTDARLEPAGHRTFLAAEMERWGKLIRDAGVYAD